MKKELENFNVTVKQLKYLHDIIDDLKKQLKNSNDELNWFRSYGEYISANYSSIDAEGCSYADGDYDDDGYNYQKKVE